MMLLPDLDDAAVVVDGRFRPESTDQSDRLRLVFAHRLSSPRTIVVDPEPAVELQRGRVGAAAATSRPTSARTPLRWEGVAPAAL